MRLFARLLVTIVGNGLGLFLSARFITGFHVQTDDLTAFATLALALAALNILVKPVLKLILGPIIVLTLGLGLIAVNALILLFLDFLSQNLTIDSVAALLLGSLLVGLVNFVFHLARKK